VDAQLMQIKEKLAAFREQDTEFRERIDSLNDSVSELASRSSLSSFTSSECSDLDSLEEASMKEFEQQGAKVCIPTVQITVTGCRDLDHFNHPLVRCFQMRRAISDPNSIMMYEHQVEKEAEVMETRRHSSYLSDHYPQYDNPEEISTLF